MLEMREGSIFLDVWNCQVSVARWRQLPKGHYGVEYASNSEALEEAAQRAVSAQGGGINMSGYYACPEDIAQRAEWAEETGSHE